MVKKSGAIGEVFCRMDARPVERVAKMRRTPCAVSPRGTYSFPLNGNRRPEAPLFHRVVSWCQTSNLRACTGNSSVSKRQATGACHLDTSRGVSICRGLRAWRSSPACSSRSEIMRNYPLGLEKNQEKDHERLNGSVTRLGRGCASPTGEALEKGNGYGIL